MSKGAPPDPEEEMLHIAISDADLKHVSSLFWFPFEKAIVAIKAKGKGFKPVKYSVVLTRGALYVMKGKKLKIKFALLGLVLTLQKGWLTIERRTKPGDEPCSINLKSPDVEHLVRSIVTVVHETFYEVKKYPRVEVHPEDAVEMFPVHARVRKAAKWRFVMSAHMKRVCDKETNAAEFLDRYVGRKSSAVIGSGVNVGGYGDAFGRALNTENTLDHVGFQSFSLASHPEIMPALLSGSRDLLRVRFHNDNSAGVDDYGFSKVKETSVCSWGFKGCSMSFVANWIKHAAQLPEKSVTHFVISGSTEKLADIIPAVQESRVMENVQNLAVTSMHKIVDPRDDLCALCVAMTNLRSLHVFDLSCDATQLLCDMFKLTPHVKDINLIGMVFKADVPDQVKVPPGVTVLSISMSKLTGGTMCSILRMLTREPRQVPISFSAVGCARTTGDDDALIKMDFSRCYPTLCEINWGYNAITALACDFLFAFFYTQKRLTFLGLSKCCTDNLTSLFGNVVKLVLMLPLYGLDVSSIDTSKENILGKFIEAISACKGLRRLNVSMCKGGDEGLKKLDALLDINPDVFELSADGFHVRDKALLTSFWSKLATRKGVKVRDYPQEDMGSLGMDASSFADNKTQKVFNRLYSERRSAPPPHIPDLLRNS